MTTQSAPARPYSVFVDVPVINRGLVTFKDKTRFVDRALKPGQIDSYGLLGSSRVKTVAACFLDASLTWLFPAAFFMIQGIKVLVLHDYAGLGWLLGIFLASVVAIIMASRFLGHENDAVDAAIADMKGLIAPIPNDDTKWDLVRIQKALNILQPEHGTAFDDRAREAAAAVLDQNLHRPNDKHLIIADSTAEDADSVAIRKRTLEAKASWSRDVARAEHLILELEDAAAGSVPAAV